MKQQFRKILVVGAGPVVIGQSAEYDYAGTQMCRVLKQEGIEVVSVNSNPTTVMTDRRLADSVYIEPLNSETIKKIIETEKPDAVLATAGGKTGLEICLELAQNGYLEEHHAVLLGAQPEVIKSVRNEQALQTMLQAAKEPYLPSAIVSSETETLQFAEVVGYPVSCKSAFSAEGGAFIRCDTEEALIACFTQSVQKSLVGQAMLTKCVEGYKEIEFACIRDTDGNCISVCSTENIDAVGVHTGDSIAVLPAQTLRFRNCDAAPRGTKNCPPFEN